MCILAWNWQPESATPLVLLSNRDEFYARPALPAHWWDAEGLGPAVLAGKDLLAGGTWLGVSRQGRLAALTNYRTPVPARSDTPSRGALVADFLQGTMNAADYLDSLRKDAQDYNPFNLLVFDGRQLLGLESRGAHVVPMDPGIGAVSNADFQTPWPKLTRLKDQLRAHLETQRMHADQLLPLLHDRTLADDAALPSTGVALPLERALSATFIATPGYGTRACSTVHVHQTHIEFTEQSFAATGLLGSTRQTFSL
jgi:uncharacterized protein with NRDE domain